MTSSSQETPREVSQSAPQPTAKVARLRLDRPQQQSDAALRADRDGHWASLRQLKFDLATAERHRLFVQGGESDIVARFDFLRTMVAGAMHENGLIRLGVCAPTSGCGASFVAANLALSMARRPSTRVLLADMNLRKPGLARLFGTNAPGGLGDVLSGTRPFEDHLRIVGENLALLLNGQSIRNSAELLQEPTTAQTLRSIRERYAPTVEIYDLPPLLESDETLSFLPQVDGILLVADGTRTTAGDMTEAERIYEGRSRLVGLVLNRGELRQPLYMTLGNLIDRLFGRRKKD